MRDLKFRAWDKRMGEWDYLNLEDVFDWEFHQTLFYCEPDTLGQYTGLLDKNSKEIYEGDIVSEFGQDIHQNKIENRYPVCFGLYDNDEEYGDWVGGNGWYLGKELFFRSSKREAGGWERKCGHLRETDKLEVIGNIYEHKELLECQ